MADQFNVDKGDITGPDHPDAAPEERLDIPDKFMNQDGSVNVEALTSSYRELEKKISTPAEDPTPEQSAEIDKAVSLITPEETETFNKELIETGDLSKESYESLVAKGIPQEMVERYVSGQKAEAAKAQDDLYDTVGGEETYGKVMAWAKDNISKEEADAFDSAIDTGNIELVKMSVRGLHARYIAANGRPNLISGDVSGGTSGSAYRSWAEVTKAMKDPRYQSDPSYQADVQNKLSLSDLGNK